LSTASASDVKEFVAAGYRAGGISAPLPWWRMPSLVPAAAVVVLIFALAVPQLMHREESPSTAVFRGTGIHALSPAGTIDTRTVQFVWSTGISAGRFRIEIGNGQGVIFNTEAAASPWPMPAAVKEQLRPGSEYWWQVTVLDVNGAPVSSSERRSFVFGK
jgi:hypothetical protein